MTITYEIPEWGYAHGGPLSQGKIKSCPEDFVVHEVLGFQPEGSGEHCFIHIEKRGENTEFVARRLAGFAGVTMRDVGYAGLKDRHALTNQWFSLCLAGKPDPDWNEFADDNIKIINTTRHAKKLKRGALAANEFTVTVRQWQGDKRKTIAQLAAIKKHGVPNYFGAQRFGNGGRNVSKALAMLQGKSERRQQRSLYLSAARSFLFNHILSFRVNNLNWNQAVPGDAFCFDRSGKYFTSQQPDTDIRQRIEVGLIHPTGTLWGTGEPDISADSLAQETQIVEAYSELLNGLRQAKVVSSRRALRVNVMNLEWEFNDENTLALQFSLPSGSYATAVLRETLKF